MTTYIPNPKILDFIRREKYAVISSVNQAGQSESALIAFSETESYEIIFMTNEKTRKIQNILLNPNVSIVVGFDPEVLTSIQMEGVARVLLLESAGEYADIHYQKQPGSLAHKKTPGECIVVINLLWARYTNYSPKQTEVFEEHFDVD